MSHESHTQEQLTRPIEQVSSPAELLPSLKNHAQVTICETAPLTDADFFIQLYNGKKITFFLFEDEHDPHVTFDMRIAKRWGMIHNALIRSGAPENVIDQIHKTFRDIVSDVEALMALFPQYRFLRDYLSINRVSEDAAVWHKDDQYGRAKPGTLRLVRTYAGPATDYAQDSNGIGAVHTVGPAVTLHTTGVGGAWHRAPVRGMNEARIVLAITLEPIE